MGTVFQTVNMGALDSVADFSLNGEIFQAKLPLFNTAPKLTEKEVKIVVSEPDDVLFSKSKSPIALIFGWGGSNHKNVAKYSAIYQKAGCTTVQYVLPTRHLFKDCDQIPEIMDNVLTQLEAYNILNRPVYIHCLCDTGVMCYQGLDIAAKQSRKTLDIQGVVWDSCPGPFPEVTVVRVFVFTTVFLLCVLRDLTTGEVSLKESLLSSYWMFTERFLPCLVKKWKGKPIRFSLIQGIWAGHFGRDHFMNRVATPELFLYSNSDYYLPHQYLEKTVLAKRRDVGTPFRAVMFKGSAHVAHLRNHSKAYKEEITKFVTKGV